MRPHPEKDGAILIDFVDMKVPVLFRQSLERQLVYDDVLGIPVSQSGVPPRVSVAGR